MSVRPEVQQTTAVTMSHAPGCEMRKDANGANGATQARALPGEGRLRMASRNDGKDFTMATKDSSSKAQEAQQKESNKKSKGQKTSSERGTATNQKKSPGKRPQQGGSSR